MKRLIFFICSILIVSEPSACGEGTTRIAPSVTKEVKEKGISRVIIGVRASAVSATVSASSYLTKALPPASAGTAAITPLSERTLVAHADQKVLEALNADSNVDFIIRDEALPPTAENQASLLGANEVWSAGSGGSGVAIAVLDTGIDGKHPILAGKVKSEACFSVADPITHSVSLCPAGVDIGGGNWIDTSEGSGINCPTSVLGCEHGTHVAGIAVGHERSDGAFKVAGIARDAELVSIQVFSRFDRPEDCGFMSAPCALSYISSQLRALQFVHSKVLERLATGKGPRIVAVNMSLGSGNNPTICDKDNVIYAKEIASLRDNGVAVFVAAGNNGYVDGVNFPACISQAVAIGALNDPGSSANDWSIAKFSNRSGDALVSLLTFGVNIRSSVPGGGYKVLSGTSMATPLAAGAYAILAGAFPAASVEEIIKAFRDSGLEISEPVSGKKLTAVRLAQAYATMPRNPTMVGKSGTSEKMLSQPSPAATTRFIVEVPEGNAMEKTTHLQQSLTSISEYLDSGKISVAPIGASALSLTTERPVDPATLQEKIRSETGSSFTIRPDFAIPPSK